MGGRAVWRGGCMVLALALVSGCASPLEQVPKLSEVDVVDAPVAEIAAGADDGTLFERLFGGEASEPTEAPSAPVDPEAEAPVAFGGGLLGRLFGREAPQGAETEATALAPQEESQPSEEDRAEPSDRAKAALASEAREPGDAPSGLFARLFSGRDRGAITVDPDVLTPASAETPAALGTVIRACGVGRRALGTEVGASGGFRLFDTIPQATGPRPHHITGFADGCPRRFSATLAFIGDPAGYEVARYDRMNRSVPWTELDDAYAALKARLCGVAARAPCGEKMARMTRSTAIVSAYPTFGTNTDWTEILLHRRKLVAVAHKRRQ